MRRSVNFVFTLDQSLRNCAKILGQSLDRLSFEEHESENYVNGQFYRASADGLEFTLAYNNDESAETYRFWLNVAWTSQIAEADFIRGMKETLWQGISKPDLQIAHVIDFGKKSQKIVPFWGHAKISTASVQAQNESVTENTDTLIGEKFAMLEVVDQREVGSFLDWGQEKDLLLPRNEETRPIRVGQKVIVAIYNDKQGRPIASMRLDRHLSKEAPRYQENQQVSLLLVAETDLGFKAIVDQKHWGMLYRDEVFQRLRYGQKLQGFIKKIREDGKIDLRINQPGHRAAQTEIGPLILEEIKKAGGFLNITDKTDPERIYQLFGVSKKKYKVALGDLYKKRLILIEDKGIRLVKTTKA